jgi:DNA-binding protein H-NS
MNLKSMSIDKLSKFRDQVEAALSAKVIEERRALQGQLGNLERLATGRMRANGGRGGPRGVVAPKYRNPENPAETWAGRGLKPRWLAAALKSGKKLEHFSITAPETPNQITIRSVRVDNAPFCTTPGQDPTDADTAITGALDRLEQLEGKLEKSVDEAMIMPELVYTKPLNSGEVFYVISKCFPRTAQIDSDSGTVLYK